MRSPITLLVLFSFIALAVFGIFGMAGEAHHTSGFGACVGSLTQGITCPANDPIASSAFHLNSFKAFSNSPLAQSSVLLVIIASLLLAAALKFTFPDFELSLNTKPLTLNKIFEISYQPFKEEKILWHSLHENSPSVK